MWDEPKKMDEPTIVRGVLDAAGFDSARWFELIQSAPVKDELLRNTEQSVERGTFGSPTFFVDGEIFFGKDRLREVEEMIVGN